MDEQRFDQISRRLAGFRTRRQAVKAITGAVVATVVGGRGAAATVSCTPHYSSCGDDVECCAGSVCEYGLCMPGCRIDGIFSNAWLSPPGNVCQVCSPDESTTSWSSANEGMSCWSGDPNAGATFCQSGACVPNEPAGCAPPPPCYTDELVDPATCTYAVAEEGTLCGNGSTCYDGFYQPADMCDGNGFCIGGGSRAGTCAPYVCGADACTTSCQADTDCVNGAHCDDGLCYMNLELGARCDEDSDCQSGFCAGWTCCVDRSCPCLYDPAETTADVSGLAVPGGLRLLCVDGPGFPDAGSITNPICPVIEKCDTTYVPLSYSDNRFSIAIAAYDRNGAFLGFIEERGTRYAYSATVDAGSQTVTFYGQNNTTSTVTWAQLDALATP